MPAFNKAWPWCGWLLALGVALACASSPRNGWAADPAPLARTTPDPFEPTVTHAEATRLQDAMKLADSDLPAAIALLAKGDGAEASAAIDYALANLYVQTNRLDEAVAAYGAAIQKLPHFRAARNNLARVDLMQDHPEQAVAAFGELLRDGQGDADTYLLLGHALTLSGQELSAEGAYRQALLQRPGDADARRGLAKCLLDQQRYAEAGALLAEMVRTQPEQTDLWSLRASVDMGHDRTDAALCDLETARRLGAATPEMLATLGDLYFNRQQPAEAVAAYDAALAQGPVPVARQLRAAEALLAVNAPEAAQHLLDRLATTEQKTPAAFTPDERLQRRRLLADLARLRGNTSQARTAYQDLLHENPLDGEALLALGELDEQGGHQEEAAMAYEQASRVTGFEARALVRQAQLEVSRGRYARAVELLESAQSFDARPNVARYLEQVRQLVK